ncbi:hypothetical protein HK100_003448, partial [Physocladia obscura]
METTGKRTRSRTRAAQKQHLRIENTSNGHSSLATESQTRGKKARIAKKSEDAKPVKNEKAATTTSNVPESTVPIHTVQVLGINSVTLGYGIAGY